VERRQGRKGHVLLDECFHRGFSLTLWPCATFEPSFWPLSLS
jgi:hypothetical protein